MCLWRANRKWYIFSLIWATKCLQEGIPGQTILSLIHLPELFSEQKRSRRPEDWSGSAAEVLLIPQRRLLMGWRSRKWMCGSFLPLPGQKKMSACGQCFDDCGSRKRNFKRLCYHQREYRGEKGIFLYRIWRQSTEWLTSECNIPIEDCTRGGHHGNMGVRYLWRIW